MKNRHRAVLRLMLLAALQDGPLSPTHLARRVNIPYDRLLEYLEPLLSGGMVRKEETEGNVSYHATLEGLKLLREGESVMMRLGSPIHKM